MSNCASEFVNLNIHIKLKDFSLATWVLLEKKGLKGVDTTYYSATHRK